MIKIKESHSEGIKSDGKNHVRAEFFVDTAAELVTEYKGFRFTMGSIAYAIAEKTFFVLDSNGVWESAEGGALNGRSVSDEEAENNEFL